MVPDVVQLGGQPYFTARNPGVPNALPDFCFVPIGEGSIDVAVADLKGVFDSFGNDIRGTLPGSETDGWDLVAGIKKELFPGLI